MLTSIIVQDHMARDVVAVRPDTLASEAIRLLLKHKISGMPVLDKEGKLVGMLTERDCLKTLVHARYYELPSVCVGDLMSTDVETVDPEMGIVDVASLFLEKPFHRLPVMDDGQLVGLISRSDVLRAIDAVSPG